MVNEIWIGVYYNLYESKRYFCAKLGEALQRQGFNVRILDFKDDQSYQIFGNLSNNQPKPYFFCSFNRTERNSQGQFFFDIYKIPNLSILVDPAIYDSELVKSPYSIISCVDKFDCEFIQNLDFHKVFFFPHAVEQELAPDESQERPYEVVFLGSCYDQDGLQAAYQPRYSEQVWKWIEEGIDMYLSEPSCTFWKAAEWVKKMSGFPSLSANAIAYYIDNYVRGLDRIELIRSIKDAQIHVFGGTCWRAEQPVKGWSQLLANQANVIVHPAITFQESMGILKQSKICLNSMPFFKNGTHERIFTGLACGCLPITTENLWIKENFIDGEELVLYQSKKWDAVNDKVNYFLTNERERLRLVNQGRSKVMLNHTWDNRAELLAKLMPTFIEQKP